MTPENNLKIIRTKKKVCVDFDALFDAFSASETDCFINLNTGQVIALPQNKEWFEEERVRLRAERGTFKEIDPFPAKLAFSMMESFVGKLEKKNPAQGPLTKALKGPKPFRKFKDVLEEHQELTDQWTKFRRKEMEYWIPNWIRKNNIDVEVVVSKAVDEPLP